MNPLARTAWLACARIDQGTPGHAKGREQVRQKLIRDALAARAAVTLRWEAHLEQTAAAVKLQVWGAYYYHLPDKSDKIANDACPHTTTQAVARGWGYRRQLRLWREAQVHQLLFLALSHTPAESASEAMADGQGMCVPAAGRDCAAEAETAGRR
jgi:hypothetical protein